MPKLPEKVTRSTLRIPQARVLRALLPDNESTHWIDWPTLTRCALASKAGFIPTTGTINRVLNGIPTGSSSGEPHLGLIERGLIKVVVMEINDGVFENSYRITAKGIKEIKHYLALNKIPKRRDKALCVNDRYAEK